jgi:branched-chain amino acid transport system permease protein
VKLKKSWGNDGLQLFILAVFLILPLFNLSSYLLNMLIMMFLFAFLASGWNILGGFAGQHSLGHAAFVGIGAYTSTYLFNHYGLSPWIGMWIGGFFAALFALFLGYSAFRFGLKGPYFLLVTIAAAQIIMLLVLNIRELGGASGITVPFKGHFPMVYQFESKITYYYVALGLLMLGVLVSHYISRHRLGYYLVAIRENDDAAQALGIHTLRYKLIATFLSAFLSALGGTFYAQYILFIDPESVLSLGLSIEIIVYPILGGIGTVLGPAIGAFILYPVGELARYLWGGATAGIHLLFYGAFLIICIIFMPEGVIGLMRNLPDTLKGKWGGGKAAGFAKE